jgi:hypothetical protein
MVRHTGVPDMGYTQGFDFIQSLVGKIVELTNSILFEGTPWLIGCFDIPEQTGKNLINNNFFIFHSYILAFVFSPHAGDENKGQKAQQSPFIKLHTKSGLSS